MKLIPVLLVLKQMQTGELDGIGFSLKLNRDKTLQAGFKALVTSEGELVKLTGEFATLSALREGVRESRSKESQAAADSFSLGLTKELLEPLGTFFPVVGTGRDKSTDFSKPVVPVTWDFDQMLTRLRRRKVLLQSLPLGVDRLSKSLVGRGLYSSPISQCRNCKFFDAQCCALERHVDWGEEGFDLSVDAPLPCEDFDRMPARLS